MRRLAPASASPLSRADDSFELDELSEGMDAITRMLDELESSRRELDEQASRDEDRAKVRDPSHWTYPTAARAARERSARIGETLEALREHHALMLERERVMRDAARARIGAARRRARAASRGVSFPRREAAKP